MTTALSFPTADTLEAIESPIYIVEGAKPIFALTFHGVPTYVSSAAYYAGSETGNGISTTIFNVGTPTVSGYTLTMTTAGDTYPFVGRRTYTINVTVTISSETVVKYFKVRVRKDESMA
jgi:hypothetical protein